jgi:cell surface protein SprA
LKRQYLTIAITLFFAGNFLTGWAQTEADSIKLPYTLTPQSQNPYDTRRPSSNIDFKTDELITTEIVYDVKTNQYIVQKKIGNVVLGAPYTMNFDEFQQYNVQQNLKKYWDQRYKSESFEHQSSLIPKINIGSEAFETIFGSNTIDIKPSGSAALKFGIKITNSENPNQHVDLRRNTTFDFKEEIQMSVVGKIGDNLEMRVSYDTESQFDFDNTMNLRYQGKEDDILQKIEAGDVSMPLSTSLISGSQSLFGILTEMKFGNLYITSIFSQQEGETKTIMVEGGAQKSSYNLSAIDYDRNRHFFLSHYFRTHYDEWLANLPMINSPINITKIEVWVTNSKKETSGARNIMAFMDLGEEKAEQNFYNNNEFVLLDPAITTYNSKYPTNKANSLYQQVADTQANPGIRNINMVSRILNSLNFEGGKHYEKVEYARKLGPNEFTLNERLGYISLNLSLNSDEVLAVAYEYTANGDTYKVGEFSQDGIIHPDVLVTKLLKGTNFNPLLPNWKLMMKNVYSIGGYQLSQEDFRFEVEYYDDNIGTRVLNIPDRKRVLSDSMRNEKFIRHMNLDNLNSQGNYLETGDGVFDFVEGVTILSQTGRIIFPVVEPFGRYLYQLIDDNDLAERLAYQALYDSTQFKAKQITSKNKFFLSGDYKSSGGSEIFLNSFNIPQGSVKVTAGGIVLQENLDYSVDYNLGRVKILNESYLASGTPLKISLESNALFSIQSKTLMGTHFDYRFNSDFNLGATIMNLTERPLTQKVNMGDEPINNTIWGLNGSYRTDVPFLTRMIDRLPFLETKEMSSITVEGEFAHLIPGHNKAIGANGNAFIDDFEGSESSIDLRSRVGWVLSSIPHDKEVFPESDDFSGLSSGYNRALLAWYQIDPIFFRSTSTENVNDDQLSSLQVYRVNEREIYPNRDTPSGQPTEITTLDLAFYPEERGPYNFDTEPTVHSAGLNNEGKLNNPETRWAGIMRELNTKDFEAQNVEYIMFWMMDPFVEGDTLNPGGKLNFNLGNISEDILKDGRKSYENGLPTGNPPAADSYIETQWGRVPAFQAVTTEFVQDADLRIRQDVGFDGLSGTIINEATGMTDEQEFHAVYLNYINQNVTDETQKANIIADPAADDFRYFRGAEYDSEEPDILERYKKFSNSEGNTPVNNNANVEYTTTGQVNPDVEDINGDFTLSEGESYFHYTIDLRKENLKVGSGFVTDALTSTVEMENGLRKEVTWYQFKIPINNPDFKVGTIQDFKSIRFIRMFLNEWSEDVVLRFGALELVRSEWRKYDYAIREGGESIGGGDESHDPNIIPFTVSTVNIEENGNRAPVPYVLPPGVDRQQDPSNPQLQKLNEQSMALKVTGLEDGYAKAVYKTLNMDMRDYGKLQMYVHAESMFDDFRAVNDFDVSCFVRLGADFTDNYYEYEVPLRLTPWGSRSREDVWPVENNLVIVFEELVNAKLDRNKAMRRGNSEVSYVDAYTYYTNSGKRIIVKGNPNLANVNTLMIGIKNPKAKFNNLVDDRSEKSVEVWVNELRLTDFDEKGGWAATGRVSARLADFGTLSVAGSTTQPGFGSIEQSGQERAKEETNQIDVATNLELGKFFPKEANVRIPMFLGYSRTAINPEYNPLDQDVKLETTLKDESLTKAEKEELVKQVQDLTERKSLNFTNVGIGRSGKGKTRFYSPSNLSATYAYSELAHRDVGVKYNTIKTYMGALNYVYNNQPKNYVPFKKVKLLNKPTFKLIGDFNFYLAPQQLSFRSTMNRKYSETQLRNLNNPEQFFIPTYDKNFYWNNQFDIKYNFSRGLKFTFTTNTNALIEEPDGLILKETYDEYKKKVWQSIRSFGAPNTYNQKFDATYTLPINKIPLLDFVSANARYAATYDWKVGATLKEGDLGNTIKNTQQTTLNGQFNMDRLYNKVGFIDKIDKKYKRPKQQRKKPTIENVKYVQEGVRFKGGTARRISHNLGTQDNIVVKAKVAGGKEVKADVEILSENRVSVTLERDAEDVTIEVTGKKEKHDNLFVVGLEHIVLGVTGVKQVSGTFTQTRGTALYGYTKEHSFDALYKDPGLPFIFGWQDEGFAMKTALNDGIINDARLVSPYTMTDNIAWNFKTTYQPVRDLRIDFTGQRSETEIMSEYYLPQGESDPVRQDRMQSGSYNTNIWMLGSAFAKKPDLDNLQSEAFLQYKKNLYAVANRLAAARVQNNMEQNLGYDYAPVYSDSIFPQGFNSTNPDVALPAFLAAYTNVSASNVKLNFYSWAFFRPSWRVKYDGLKNIDFLAKYFKNISLSHGYNAAFTVGGFKTNLAYNFDDANDPDIGMSWAVGGTDSALFVSQYDISSFAATEQFIPLFGIDVTWKNNILTRFEYKKTRNLTMSLVNNQMVEVYSWEYTIGSGYRFDKLKIIVNQKPIVSDLNLRADVSIRDNISITHDLSQNNPQATQGQKVVTTKISADYRLSDNLNFQAYYDRTLTNPKVGSFKTVVTEFGFRFQFTLANL